MSDSPMTVKEHFEAWGASMIGLIPPPLQILMSGKPPIRIDGQWLDPQTQLLLAARERRGYVPLPQLTPQEARAQVQREALIYGGPRIVVGAVEDLTVAGAGVPLRARHYAPRPGRGPQPLVVFFHGGGFVVGDLDTHDAPCRLLCREADVHVLSVAYRLAPEHPFPAAIEDGLAAFRWACHHAEDLGADPKRIAVAGDSAGGNIAAVVSQLASRDGGPAPAMQLLIYPAIDRSQPWKSMDLFADGFYLTVADRDWFDAQYLGSGPIDRMDPRISPLQATDLSGLPPALIISAGFDPLRDEAEAYADALKADGTKVTMHRMSQFIHAFINMVTFSPAAREATTWIARETRSILERV